MTRHVIIALRMAGATLVLTGVLYPLVVTALAQSLFPHKANGSLLSRDGRTVGSALIGQRFVDPAYFQGRPSAAGAEGYDASASGGSNLGPTSRRLRERVSADLARLREWNPMATGPVPAELVTASGSGLDPHLSPDAARWQAPRVAAARGVPVGTVDSLIGAATEPRGFGLLGEPRVNVLLLNLALDRRLGPPARTGR